MSINNLSNDERNSLINNWIHSERDRNILRSRFIDGIKIETIAEDFDLSVRQINNILYDGKKTIEDKINLH